jgi:hypothetical protein
MGAAGIVMGLDTVRLALVEKRWSLKNPHHET